MRVFCECRARFRVRPKVEALVISSKDSLPIKQNVSPWNSRASFFIRFGMRLADVVVDVRQKFRRSPAVAIAAKLCGAKRFHFGS